MSAPVDPSLFRPALIILATAGVVIPVFHRLRVSPVLGFIISGLLVGPFGVWALLGRPEWLAPVIIAEPENIAPIAELGVVTLMFMIGLELSFERLVSMRRLVFGLGALQVVLCAVVLGAAGLALGLPLVAALVIGVALTMSSTAVVVQVLSEEERLGGPVGRSSLAVLIFQDLAAVPILFVISVLGHGGGTDAEGGTWALLVALAQAVPVVLALVGFGRLALRPLFRSVARTGIEELFMAACLLVILATGLATAAAGLSMAMGALIAGLLLAETEFRRQIEVTIEPFKGLLLGVFLISVGMSLDLPGIVAGPLPVLLGAVALLVLKLAVIVPLGRLFGLRWTTGLQAGLLLAPGGEFGFVILGLALASGLLPAVLSAQALGVAAVTMALIPLLSRAGRVFADRATPVDPALLPPAGAGDVAHVIIGGFGRVGETVALMLEAHRVPYVAIDNDADRVAAQRRLGRPVWWGDITRVEMLHLLRLDTARALVVTMTERAAADRLVATARAERAELLIVARARDGGHAAQLYAIGATDAVPETIEASLQLAEALLVDLGVPMGPVIASIHEQRAAFQAEIRAMAPRVEVRPLGRRRLRDLRAASGDEPGDGDARA
jgi:CPA2 family monovalent cation:H+ antiporter-2